MRWNCTKHHAPKLYFPPTTDSDPEEIEAQRVRVLLAEQATLLAAAGDLPQCANLPERAYETCRKHLGVVGESTIFDNHRISLLPGCSVAENYPVFDR